MSTPQTTVQFVTKLLVHHDKKREECGLSKETIRRNGIYSETNPEKIAALLGWRKPTKGLAPAIVFPFTSADGHNGYARVRPDTPRTIKGKPVKYESPKEQPNRIYIPDGVARVLDDPTAELLITEGELKALAATEHLSACIGLVGVYGWKERRSERLLVDLERVKWAGRTVYIIFDSDIDRKPDVQLAESRLAKHLTDRGAIVKCVRLPDGDSDESGEPTKLGLDDYIVKYGAGELRKLLDSAVEPEPVEGAAGKENAAGLDPSTEAKAFLESTKQDGVLKQRHYRGEMIVHSGGCWKSLEPADARARVVRFLDKNYSHLGTGITSNVLDHIKANCILSADKVPPCWLGEPLRPWQPQDILAAQNGLVHLPTLTNRGQGFLLPPTPRFFCESATDFNFDVAAPPPELWLSLLNQYWPDDEQSINVLQEWYGLSLVADTSFQKILMVLGPTRSGKGLIARILRRLVGERNVGGPALANLATNFGLSQLIGKSVGIISDARLSGKADQAVIVERLLSISGEDVLTADRKNQSAITVTFPTRLVILSNELPRLHDSSGALAGRMLLLRMRQSFYGREDRKLTNKLIPELPGILLWSIEGWRRLHERGRFEQPESGDQLASELRDLSSPVGMFVRERCVVGPEHSVPRATIFNAYRDWSKERGRDYVEDEIGFGRALRAVVTNLGDSQPRLDGERIRHYTGIGLNGAGGF